MVNTVSNRKRPCRICRIWFVPNPRLKDRQKTCSRPACQKEWHRKQCKRWNKKNRDYFRANYLQKKLDVLSKPSSGSPQNEEPRNRVGISTILPAEVIIGELGLKQFIILDYVCRSLLRRWQSHSPET